jgi:hypothetical protein
MKRLVLALLVGSAAALAFAACGSEETTGGSACDPGEEIFCRCRGGIEGTKTCQDDGQTFGECLTLDGACPEIPDDASSGPGGDDGDEDDGAPPVCFPYDEVPCTCDDGSNGVQVCDPSGDALGVCSAAGAPCADEGGATGVTSSSASGGGGTGPLLTPCTDASECASGACLMGMCTKECGNWQDCVDGETQGECARFAGGSIQLCAPYCTEQNQCVEAYGDESRCGYGVAPDDPGFAFLVCGDWGADLEVPPLGTSCAEDVECHLNLAGVERICIFESCEEGCHVADDCPEDRPTCSSDGSVPGTCG